MATNENEIGVKGKFDLDEFRKNYDQYVARLDRANAETEKFYKKQTEAQNKAADASKKSTDKQSASLRQMKEAAEQARTTMLFVFGGIIAGYKFLEEESKRLGDKETIAAFTALEQSVKDLGDSFAAMVLQGSGVDDILKFIASGITAFSQVVTITGSSLKWFFALLGGIPAAIDLALKGKGNEIGKYFEDLNARANAAANDVIIAAVKAPEQVKATTAQVDIDKKAKEAEDKRLKDIADYYAKIVDLQIKSGESILAAEDDLHSKSASAWADYIEKSADIIAEGVKKRAELLSTYTNAINSAESEYQKANETAAYEHGKKLADIERDYQNTIRQINETYGEESLDAARNLDAIGFVRAKEKRDSALQDAETSRDQANASENENYSRQLFELQRNLEDKKREAENAYRRGLEEQRRAEQDAQNSAKDSYNKQLTDVQNAFNARLTAIQTAYTNEDTASRSHYLNQETMLQQHLAAMRALMASYGISTANTNAPVSGQSRRRAEGGLDMVSSPTQFIAGEAGPEMVLTIPMNRAVSVPIIQTVNHTGDFSHQIDSTIKSSVAGIDGRITAAVAKALREVLV